jgi:hypothetical protein
VDSQINYEEIVVPHYGSEISYKCQRKEGGNVKKAGINKVSYEIRTGNPLMK